MYFDPFEASDQFVDHLNNAKMAELREAKNAKRSFASKYREI
jgi:hypothetical protein